MFQTSLPDQHWYIHVKMILCTRSKKDFDISSEFLLLWLAAAMWGHKFPSDIFHLGPNLISKSAFWHFRQVGQSTSMGNFETALFSRIWPPFMERFSTEWDCKLGWHWWTKSGNGVNSCSAAWIALALGPSWGNVRKVVLCKRLDLTL